MYFKKKIKKYFKKFPYGKQVLASNGKKKRGQGSDSGGLGERGEGGLLRMSNLNGELLL